MDEETLRLLRGGVELADDAICAAVGAIAATHDALARRVYAPFALLGPLALPARLVEQLQAGITREVYATIVKSSQAVARGAAAMLERQAERGQDDLPEAPPGPAPARP